REPSTYFVSLTRSHSLAVSKLCLRNHSESGACGSIPLFGESEDIQGVGGIIRYQPTSARAAAWRDSMRCFVAQPPREIKSARPTPTDGSSFGANHALPERSC